MSPSDQEILAKYDQEFHQYANKVMPAFPNFLQAARQPYEPFLKRIHDFYLFSSFLVDEHLFPNDPKYVPLRTLYAKSSLSLFAVYLCLRNGLVTEVAVLLRSLFETYVNALLILQTDVDNRLTLFDDFRFVERWNNIQANRKLVEQGKLSATDFGSTFSHELIKEVEDKFNSIRENYHPRSPYHWAWKIFRDQTKDHRNPSLKLIAESLGLSVDYVKLYGALSISVHNSPNLLNLVSSGGAISLAPSFTNQIYRMGGLTIDYVGKIIDLIVTYLAFRNPEEIHTYIAVYSLAALDDTNLNDE
jgi:hypothetical protein